MNALIQIQPHDFGGSIIQTVNARELHTFLEVGTAFKDWIARRVSEYDFSEGTDFCSFLSESDGGRPAKEYAISLDMAKELAMVERTEKGKQARQYFIECERRATSPQLPNFANPVEAARAWADATEKALQLQAEVHQSQALIEQQRPAVEFLNRYVEAKSLREVAKVLGVKEREFIAKLEADGILFRQSGSLLPAAHYQHKGYFEVKTGEANGHAFHQCRFTPAGLSWIAGRFVEVVA